MKLKEFGYEQDTMESLFDIRTYDESAAIYLPDARNRKVIIKIVDLDWFFSGIWYIFVLMKNVMP